MAFTLEISDHSSNYSGGTIGLTVSPIKVLEYQPLVSLDGSDIRETVRLDFYSPTQQTNFDNIQVINRYIDQAVNYQRTGIGPRVYIQFDPGVSGTAYRSLLKSGKLTLDQDALKTGQWTNKNLFAELEWTRDPFWEGPLTELPLFNNTASNTTGGAPIDNYYGGTAGNFVDVHASVLGDLPTPAKIQIQNTASGSINAKEFFVWNNEGPYYSLFAPFLEGEAATGSGVSPSASSGASGGTIAAISWGGTVEALAASWSLSSTFLTYAFGQRYAILARWAGSFTYTDAWLRFKVLTGNDNVLWSGNLQIVSSSRELALIDVLRLPPQVFNYGPTMQPLKLNMYGYRNTAGTHTVNLDYLQISPIARESGWLRLLSLDNGITYQDKLIYDGIEGELYSQSNSTGYIIQEYTQYGGPMMLTPNKNFRLYFNECNSAGTATPGATFNVKVWHRPRRHAL